MQAYLDTIKAKTGKTVEDFRALAHEKDLAKRGEIMTWLKTEFELGHGHANAMTYQIMNPEPVEISQDDQIAELFKGSKSEWHRTYDKLMTEIAKFGADIEVAPTQSYISLLRRAKKFAILQPSTSDRFDIGIKLKGIVPAGRLEAAGAWNNMVTYRVRISDPEQIDSEVLAWLKQAYDAA